MSITLSAMLAPVLMYERMRTAQTHRDHRVHTRTASHESATRSR
jgi:hypothetical protein